MSSFVADLRYAVRRLSQAPTFTAVAATSIALGIAANSLVFSLVNVFLLRPPPVAEPANVVRVGATDRGLRDLVVSVPEFEELRATTEAFDGIAAHRFNQVVLNTGDAPREVGVEVVSTNYFQLLGVPMAAGRDFEADAQAEAIISHALWVGPLQGSPDVLGTTVTVSGMPVTLVGVAPPGFRGTFAGFDLEIWVPLAVHDRVLLGRGSIERRGDRIVNLVARLGPDESLATAQAQLDTIAARWQRDDAALYSGRGLAATPASGVHPFIATIARPFLALLQAIVALVLLVSSANVASLLLVRATVRRREMAIRQALGASRMRLIRQQFTESLALAALGGGVGLALAWLGARLLSRIDLQIGIPVDLQLYVDPRVVAFTMLATLGTALLFGGIPAWRATSSRADAALRDARARAGRSRLLRVLVTAQVTVTCVLLIGAGLVGRSLARMQALDVGFTVDGIVTLAADPGEIGYDESRTRAYWHRLLEQVTARPGVESASLALFAPMGDRSDRMAMWAQADDPDAAVPVGYNFVDAGFLDLLDIPIVAGRGLSDGDAASTSEVAVINESAARALWPEAPAVGRGLHIRDRAGSDHLVEVVGVARDVTVSRLDEPPTPFVYLPKTQWHRMGMVLHARVHDRSSLRWLIDLARSVDPEIPVDVSTLRDEIAFSLLVPRVLGAVLGAAGSIGLLLAAVGLFGTVAYATEQRRHEIGVRVALGADAAGVIRLVLAQGLRTTLLGLVVGAFAALLLGRLLAGFLYRVSAADPLTFLATFGLLLTVGGVAGLLPAGRALRRSPAAILRSA